MLELSFRVPARGSTSQSFCNVEVGTHTKIQKQSLLQGMESSCVQFLLQKTTEVCMLALSAS